MRHRFVSRSAGVFAALAVGIGVAACDDTTTGTPLTPPPPSTAVYVNVVEPEGGYTVKDTVITFSDVDTPVTIVTPQVKFEVLYPDGTPGVGQTISFAINLPGLIQNTRATVDADGFVTPGWVIPGSRPVQRVIATPVSGTIGYVDISTTPPPPPDVATR